MEQLSDLRLKIDAVDAELIGILARRKSLVDAVLELKKVHKIPARLPDRIDEVIAKAAANAEANHLNPDLARTVWTAMVEWFVQHEERELSKP
jgi:isochorismate pyruvate lyase